MPWGQDRDHPHTGWKWFGRHGGSDAVRLDDDGDGGQRLQVIGQVGTTIGPGLVFDTLIVRTFMTPSIATLLGRWFWWPQRVRVRPSPAAWPKTGQPQLDTATGGSHHAS